jgi:Cu/Ag efflux pump CusA
MTTVATLVGLLPLALGIGAGADLQKPLAIAVIFGLVSSTLATIRLRLCHLRGQHQELTRGRRAWPTRAAFSFSWTP